MHELDDGVSVLRQHAWEYLLYVKDDASTGTELDDFDVDDVDDVYYVT